MKEQDLEREYLTDEIYIKEAEYMEYEYLKKQQKPAIIKLIVPQLRTIREQPKLLKERNV